MSEQVVSGLRDWFEELESVDSDVSSILVNDGVQPTTDGLLQVLTPGSIVAKRGAQGVLHDIEIIAPEIVSIDGPARLFYRYKTDDSTVTAMVPDNVIELVGDEYRFQEWNPQTSEYVDDNHDDF